MEIKSSYLEVVSYFVFFSYVIFRYQSRYVHLVNLLYLFDFILPALGDYLVALKLGDFEAFEEAFMKLLKFYLTCRCEGYNFLWFKALLGSLLYQRALLVSYRLMCYWKSENLPISKLLEENVTFFSEESGEIALSRLTLSLPSNHKGTIEETRRYIYSLGYLIVFLGFGKNSDCDKTKLSFWRRT